MTIDQLNLLNKAVNKLCNEYARICDNSNVEKPMTYALKMTFDYYNLTETRRSEKVNESED